MLIDVHAHLDFPQFDADRDAVIEKAKSEGIAIVNSGLGTTGIIKTLEMTERYDNVYASLGIAPTEFSEKEIEATIDLIRENREVIVAIGEVGLDHHWVRDGGKHRQQEANFRRFVALSKELKLPLVIHSRDAEEEVLRILREEKVRALMHCFGGDATLAARAAYEGHLISIPTNLAASKQKQAVVKAVPIDSIVLETDSPYLSPAPKTRNEPVNIRKTAERIAEIKGIFCSAVEAATYANAKRFFDISP